MARSVTPAALAAVLALASAGCASGPADFTDTGPITATAADTAIRTPQERDRLERSLTAVGAAQTGEGRRAIDAVPSAMALAVIRQQQEEEARALLEAAEAEAEPAPARACDPAIDPACTPATAE